jgi:hypothetical protein
MAIFRVPKITTNDRTQLVLSESEIVYDKDTASFFGGDDTTVGGFEIGKNAGLKVKTEKLVITQAIIDNKSISLQKQPTNPNDILFLPEGGIRQNYGTEFTLSGNVLTWENLGLDGFLEVDDIINITYYYY